MHQILPFGHLVRVRWILFWSDIALGRPIVGTDPAVAELMTGPAMRMRVTHVKLTEHEKSN